MGTEGDYLENGRGRARAGVLKAPFPPLWKVTITVAGNRPTTQDLLSFTTVWLLLPATSR